MIKNLQNVEKGNERKGVIRKGTETGFMIMICEEVETRIEMGVRRGKGNGTGMVIGITEIGIGIAVREGSEPGIETLMILTGAGTMGGKRIIF